MDFKPFPAVGPCSVLILGNSEPAQSTGVRVSIQGEHVRELGYFTSLLLKAASRKVRTGIYFWACTSYGQMGSRGQRCRCWQLKVRPLQDRKTQEDVQMTVSPVLIFCSLIQQDELGQKLAICPIDQQVCQLSKPLDLEVVDCIQK